MKKLKRPLKKPRKKEEEGNDEKPWWARPDEEIIKERAVKIKDWYETKKVDVDEEDRQKIIEEAVKRDPRIQNLLDMVVSRDENIKKKDEFLLVPVYTSEKGKKIASILKFKTYRRIKLDEYGRGVWNLIDGQRDVRRIGKVLSSRFGDDIDPLYPRLAKFLAYLQNLKLIEFKEK